MEELKCPICGEPTYLVYGNPRKDKLCKSCGMKANKGEIIQCPDCGKWNEKDVVCECKKKEENKAEDELTCIICGEPSNGKHFCFKCWNKYKDKSIDLRITNCKNTQILDEYGNKKITCHDGRKVRSRAEKIINDFFFDNRIRVVYEKEIPYTENDETKILHPDFYLPDYENGLFIEYNELSNPKYKRSKEYTRKVYDNLGFNILVLTDEDIDNDLLNLKIRLKITI